MNHITLINKLGGLIQIFYSNIVGNFIHLYSIMEKSQEEQKSDLFLGIQSLEEVEEVNDDLAVLDHSACILNPNTNDDRRLFQVFKPQFTWDPSIQYEDQPNRLETEGPTTLIYPDHFYEVEDGVSLIY